MLIPVTGIPKGLQWDLLDLEEYNKPDLMTREQFLSAVRVGAFIDSDGFGRLCDGFMESSWDVLPSSVLKENWPAWATHVVWYNR